MRGFHYNLDKDLNVRKGIVEIGVLKTITIGLSLYLSVIQPYLGGLAGALIFMALQDNVNFSLKTAFQRVLGGWFMAFVLVEFIVFLIPIVEQITHLKILFQGDRIYLATSLVFGFFSVPILDFLYNKEGFKKLGGLLWVRFKQD